MMMAQSHNGSGDIVQERHFFLDVEEEDSKRLDPTIASIALADYILENLKFDGIASYEFYPPTNSIFINGTAVEWIGMTGDSNGLHYGYVNWDPLPWTPFADPIGEIYILDGELYPKGTIIIYDND